ncbi:hypothetical protein WN982_00325 [Paraburkholderia sp. IMGN_8]|uniref:hypothetical protein n=1 Tax=Paraburkholderia sp. IMGN_8 TaxID=3136564 RepID=UPI003100F062
MVDKHAAAWSEIQPTEDPKEFLKAVMGNPGISMEHRIAAAIELVPYRHSRLADDDECEDGD